MDTAHIPVQRFCALLETFGLKHSSKQIADLLEKAENEEVQTVSPVSLRPKSEDVMSVDVNPSELESGMTGSQIKQLKELTWLDTCGHIVLAGPPGLGKTMIAVGLGLEAINSGYTVCFEKMVNLIKILDTAETERTAGFRLKNIKKAQMIIIDEIGYTPISRSQANKFFTFISDFIHRLYDQQGNHRLG